ncbi:peptide chain release factor 2, putative [Hepatocystis sp. ex Piliocolobus tephrosceles]|nr:peptide chain release factor 2, putative [Hepatocystis sp. ex Piliocolobus tephrosceles]
MLICFTIPLYLFVFVHWNIIICFKINKHISFTSVHYKTKNIKKYSNLIYLRELPLKRESDFEIINKKLKDIGVCSKDIIETFIKGTGKGGQKVNKTNNCVMIKYDGSNKNKIIIKCHKYRCLEKNRVYARELLYNKLVSINNKVIEELTYRLEKEKRKILKLSEKEKRKSINYKIRRSEIKKDRQKYIAYDNSIG